MIDQQGIGSNQAGWSKAQGGSFVAGRVHTVRAGMDEPPSDQPSCLTKRMRVYRNTVPTVKCAGAMPEKRSSNPAATMHRPASGMPAALHQDLQSAPSLAELSRSAAAAYIQTMAAATLMRSLSAWQLVTMRRPMTAKSSGQAAPVPWSTRASPMPTSELLSWKRLSCPLGPRLLFPEALPNLPVK